MTSSNLRFQDFISHYRKTTIFHKDTSTFKEFSYFCALKSKIRRSPERTTISQAGVQPSPSPVGAKTQNSTIMGSSLAKNDIHIVFHIKYHSMEIRDEDLGQVFAYIGGLIRNMGGIPMEIGGIGNHIHILTSLPKTIALSDFVKNIKAYSSKWIKTLDESYYEGFCWQAGYGAFSVDYRNLDQTAHYIRNQAEHHHRTEWSEEYRHLLDEAGIAYDEQYAFETD